MNLAQKIALNATSTVTSQLIGVPISLLTLRLTTGYLGVDEFGELAIIFTVGGVIIALSDLGVATTLSRELVKSPADVDRLAGHLLGFRVASTLMLALGTLAIIPALPYSSQTKLGLALYQVGVVAWSLTYFPRAFFQSHLKLYLQATVDLATRIFLLAAVFIVVVLDLGFYALVAAQAMVGVMGFTLAFWFLLRFWRPRLRWDSALGFGLVRNTVSVGVVSIVALLHFRADAILLSFLTPARDVGIYSVAYRFIDQSFFLSGPFIAAVFPILARLVHESPGRLDKMINRSFQVLALGSGAVVLGIVVLARPIVHLIAGPSFGEAIEAARILAFSLPFLFCAGLFSHVCIAANRQRGLLWVGVGSLALNVALNLVLIPWYSYNGAAVATVVSEAAVLAGSFLLARHIVGFDFEYAFLARTAAAVGVAAIVAALAIGHSELLAFILGEFALVGIALLVGAVRAADLRLVLGRERRVGAGRF